MDRTSWAVIIGCMLLLLFWGPIVGHFYQPPPQPEVPVSATNPISGEVPASVATNATAPIEPVVMESVHVPQLETENVAETVDIMESKTMRIDFTNLGGAISRVELLEHKAEEGKFVILNRGGVEPILNQMGWTRAGIAGFEKKAAGFELHKATGEKGQMLEYRREIQPGIEWSRRFFVPEDGYLITMTQTVRNTNAEPITLPGYSLNAGLGAPVYLQHSERSYLGGSWYTVDEVFSKHRLMEFDASNFLFLFPKAAQTKMASAEGQAIRWVAAKSQFFLCLLTTLDEPGVKAELIRRELRSVRGEDGWQPDGLEARLLMPEIVVPAGGEQVRHFQLYAGPKEDSRLRALEYDQEEAMEFGFLGILARPFLIALNFIHQYVHNYGIAIIILTILIKIVLWVPQSHANIGMKKMQLLQPLMKDVQDKYKDNPQKMQEELMKLYKTYGVNPMSSCLPILLQMPIFIALFYMLLSATELRHESFLWISDLSQPDTVVRFNVLGFSLPINPMPIIMAGTMYLTMQLTPQPQGVDNPALKIMKFMPILMLVFCYFYSAALSLYWTMQNILSALQTIYNNRQPMPKLEKAQPAGIDKTAPRKRKRK